MGDVDALAQRLGDTDLHDSTSKMELPTRSPVPEECAEQSHVASDIDALLPCGIVKRPRLSHLRMRSRATPPPRVTGVKRIAGASADVLVSRFVKAVRLDEESTTRLPLVPTVKNVRNRPALSNTEKDEEAAKEASTTPMDFGVDKVRKCFAAAPHLKSWLRSDAAAPLLRDLISGLHTGIECFAMWPSMELSRCVVEPPSLVGPSPANGFPNSQSIRSVVRTLRLDSEAVREVLRAAGVFGMASPTSTFSPLDATVRPSSVRLDCAPLVVVDEPLSEDTEMHM